MLSSAARKFAGSEAGAVAILSSAFLLVGIAVAALAVDLGALRVERRAIQGAADLAAIAAARDLPNADAAARATLSANGFRSFSSLKVERGVYTPDPAVAIDARFKAGQAPANAVRVTARKPGKLHFGAAILNEPPAIVVAATATSSAVAAFSIGSRLAALREGVVNQLLSGLLGGNVNLSVMDYEALLNADVDMFDFLDALASEVDVTAGTYDDVLSSSATVGDVLAAAARVTETGGNAAATAALNSLGRQSDAANVAIGLSSLIELGPLANVAIGDPAPGLDASMKAMDIVTGAAAIANGERQVEVDVATNIPGLLGLKVAVAIGEPPQSTSWVAVGDVGAKVRTAQTRLRIVAEIGGSGLLLGTKIRLPLYVDAAYAEGRLASVTCSGTNDRDVEIAARPGVAEAWVGEVTTAAMTNFASPASVSPANIVSAPTLTISGAAHIDVGSISETTLSFTEADIEAGTIKRVASTGLAQSLVTSLVGDLELKAKVLGLGLGLPGTLTSAVAAALQPVAAPLDAIVDSLLQTLGVRLGEADVRVHGVRCGASVLAG